MLQLGQRSQSVTQAGEITRSGVAQADTSENTLQVANFLELWLQRFEAIAVQQTGDGVQSRLQYCTITQRAVQPAAQQTAGHGGLAAV